MTRAAADGQRVSPNGRTGDARRVSSAGSADATYAGRADASTNGLARADASLNRRIKTARQGVTGSGNVAKAGLGQGRRVGMAGSESRPSRAEKVGLLRELVSVVVQVEYLTVCLQRA